MSLDIIKIKENKKTIAKNILESLFDFTAIKLICTLIIPTWQIMSIMQTHKSLANTIVIFLFLEFIMRNP